MSIACAELKLKWIKNSHWKYRLQSGWTHTTTTWQASLDCRRLHDAWSLYSELRHARNEW